MDTTTQTIPMEGEEAENEAPEPMDEDELKAIIEAQIQNAMGYVGGDLSQERAQAMEYYLGEPFGNEVEGRSQVVSSDVADVIEWILPALLRTFVATDEAVRFNPRNMDDVEQAAQETDYVNYVFYQNNPGFLILYTWIKDALLQKNGVIKTFWEKSKKETREEYNGLTEDQLTLLMQDPNLKVIQHSPRACIEPAPPSPMSMMPGQPQAPQMTQATVYDVVCKRIEYKGQVKIINIPPEHYLISKNHNSVDPKEAHFVAHRADKTVTELLEMGIDKEIIEDLPDAQEVTTGEQVSRQNLSDERNLYSTQSNLDDSMRIITVYECYVRVDFDGDGVAELRKVLKAGNEILLNEEVDSIPFDILTPIILPHKHFGLSIADLIMDLQLIKSTIWRQQLDNMYLINNGRHVVNENMVNLDDLLTSRPGGIVRTKGIPANDVVPLVTQPLNQGAFQMVEYIDRVREGRTGVSQTTMGLNDSLLSNNKGDASVSRMMTAATQRIELVARVFAETGIKSLFLRIHELLLKNQDQAKVVELRGKWVNVNPTEWHDRTEMTVNVGLGTGERDMLVQAMQMLLNLQEKAVASGGMDILVTLKNIHNAAADLAKYAGVRNVDLYLTDPTSEAAQKAMADQKANKKPDPTEQLIQIEHEKNQITAQKNQLEYQTKQLELQQEKAKLESDYQLKTQDMQRKFQEMEDRLAMQLTEMHHKYTTPIPKHEGNYQA